MVANQVQETAVKPTQVKPAGNCCLIHKFSFMKEETAVKAVDFCSWDNNVFDRPAVVVTAVLPDMLKFRKLCGQSTTVMWHFLMPNPCVLESSRSSTTMHYHIRRRDSSAPFDAYCATFISVK